MKVSGITTPIDGNKSNEQLYNQFCYGYRSYVPEKEDDTAASSARKQDVGKSLTTDVTEPHTESTTVKVKGKLSAKLQTDAWTIINTFVTPEQAHLIWMHEDVKFKAYYIFKDKNKSITDKKQALSAFIKRYYPDMYNSHFKDLK